MPKHRCGSGVGQRPSPQMMFTHPRQGHQVPSTIHSASGTEKNGIVFPLFIRGHEGYIVLAPSVCRSLARGIQGKSPCSIQSKANLPAQKEKEKKRKRGISSACIIIANECVRLSTKTRLFHAGVERSRKREDSPVAPSQSFIDPDAPRRHVWPSPTQSHFLGCST